MHSKPYFLLLTTGALLAMSTLAAATAQRTFVASTGNDAHACSLAQPCRSFGAAIVQTNTGGEIIVLDSAGYGPATITKPVSIIAPTGIYAGISVSVSATVTDSVFTQNGGNGIWGDTKAGATTTLLVEHSVLSNNGNDGFRLTASASAVKGNVTLTRNAINSNGANGILIDTAAPALVTGAVSQNAMQGNGGDGIQVTGPGTTTSAQIILSANSSISNQSFDARCTSAHGLILSDHRNLLLTTSSVGCHGDIVGW